jgi:hypothetical protein
MRASAAWLQWLCENIFRNGGLIGAKPEWLKNRNVMVVDKSEAVKCGIRRQSSMLHYSLDLFTLEAREFLVTDEQTGEKLANFKQLGKKDLVMGDRIYGTLPGVGYVLEQGAGYVLRIKSRGFKVYDGKNRRIDLLGRFSGLKEGKTGEITGKCVIDGRHERVRICVLRKSKESEKAGLKRLKKENRRKQGGQAVSALQREGNKYIMVATSLGKEEATAAEVLGLYRMRWQIEIAFKRLRSLFGCSDLPAKNGESVKAWFYGKLLLAALCETLVNTGRFPPCEGNSRSRP